MLADRKEESEEGEESSEEEGEIRKDEEELHIIVRRWKECEEKELTVY